MVTGTSEWFPPPRMTVIESDIYGELAGNPVFVAAFSGALTALWQNGTRETLTRYLANQPL